MARVFLRLKLSLLANGLHRGWQQLFGLLVGAAVAVPLALAAGAGLWVAGRAGAAGEAEAVGQAGAVGEAALVVAATALVAVWVVGPLVGYGLDETLDPARLWPLPLSRRRLLVGLFVASCVGLAPAATVLVLLGAVAGFAPASPMAAVTVAAAVVHLALCLVAARAVVTALSRRLRSRRGQELLAVAAFLLIPVLVGLGQVVPRLLAEVDPEVLAGLAGPLEWLPTAWTARAIIDARAGEVAPALAWLGAAAVTVALLGWWWAAGLERSLTAGDSGGPRTRRDRGLFTRVGRVLPPTRVGAVAAKELRSLFREPRQAAVWAFSLIAVAGLCTLAFLGDEPLPRLVLAAPVAGVLPALAGTNAFGADRGAFWLHVAAGVPGRDDLLGRNLAGALAAGGVIALTAVAVAVLTGGWVYVPAALIAAAGLLGTVFGVGNVSSVWAPFPLPETSANVWAGTPGQGCATSVLVMLAMFATTLLLTPAVVAVVLAAALRPGALALVGPGVAAYGVGLWWVGLRLAGGSLDRRQPEVLDALTP